MAAKLFVLTACIALSQAGLVRRDAPTANLLEDIQKHAAAFKDTISEQFENFFNSKNTEDVNKAIKENTDSVLQSLSGLSESLKNALNDVQGKSKEAIEQARNNIEKQKEDLLKQHPELEHQATAARTNIQNAFKNAVQETEKLAKELGKNLDETNQKLGPKIKEAYDDFVKQAEAIQKNVHDAANKQ